VLVKCQSFIFIIQSFSFGIIRLSLFLCVSVCVFDWKNYYTFQFSCCSIIIIKIKIWIELNKLNILVYRKRFSKCHLSLYSARSEIKSLTKNMKYISLKSVQFNQKKNKQKDIVETTIMNIIKLRSFIQRWDDTIMWAKA